MFKGYDSNFVVKYSNLQSGFKQCVLG